MDVRIEKLVYGGDGLAHHEGQAVFVPFVLPGEEVSVQPIQRKKKFVRGRVERLLSSSPERSIPFCPHFGVCGGCHYQHIPPSAQLTLKAEILRETLGRIGRVPWEGPIMTRASPPTAYRSRAQWAVRPGSAGEQEIGYFRAASSSLCAVSECGILSPRLAETLDALRKLLASGRVAGAVHEIEASADSADDRVLLNVSFEKFGAPAKALSETFHREIPHLESLLLLDRSSERLEMFGPGFITYEAAGNRYRCGHLSFFQVNRFLAGELVEAVCAEARGQLALDLFAGVGLFTLPLATQFQRVIAVDANLAATRDLKANLETAGAGAEVVNLKAEAFLSRCKDKPEFVVLDPPRAGLGAEVTEKLTHLAPQRIAYLSCDPSTLARDLAALTGVSSGKGVSEQAGARYEIREVHLFDLFPQTYHIESLVMLERVK